MRAQKWRRVEIFRVDFLPTKNGVRERERAKAKEICNRQELKRRRKHFSHDRHRI